MAIISDSCPDWHLSLLTYMIRRHSNCIFQVPRKQLGREELGDKCNTVWKLLGDGTQVSIRVEDWSIVREEKNILSSSRQNLDIGPFSLSYLAIVLQQRRQHIEEDLPVVPH